ncbi:BRO-N domain-containing protein [Mycobacterium sp. TJFP1]
MSDHSPGTPRIPLRLSALVGGEPWFVAKDVTDLLGFKNGRDAVNQHVLPGQRSDVGIHDGRQMRSQAVISEPGLYRLIMRSNANRNYGNFHSLPPGQTSRTDRSVGSG